MRRVLFARVGWMKWYRGPQPDDPKPVGGGGYTARELGNEAFNFLPLDGEVLGYFQPRLTPGRPSTIALERIEAGFTGDELDGVLVVFVATAPQLGGQRIVGWFRDATVYRNEQPSKRADRNEFPYFLKARADEALLIKDELRFQRIPAGKGAFGKANVCYALESKGEAKNAQWIKEALNYVVSYKRENIALEPESAADEDIQEKVEISIEQGAGFQSNPRIRRAIEEYAMRWAERVLREKGYKPEDKHSTQPFDFLCNVSGEELYVEVKGTQDHGDSISLTPNEVEHARKHKNSALLIVHSVKVTGKRRPVVSGGKQVILQPWDISEGILRPRGYVFTRRKTQA
jgi:tRNA-binding EMAP/Myf-like protein